MKIKEKLWAKWEPIFLKRLMWNWLLKVPQEIFIGAIRSCVGEWGRAWNDWTLLRACHLSQYISTVHFPFRLMEFIWFKLSLTGKTLLLYLSDFYFFTFYFCNLKQHSLRLKYTLFCESYINVNIWMIPFTPQSKRKLKCSIFYNI